MHLKSLVLSDGAFETLPPTLDEFLWVNGNPLGFLAYRVLHELSEKVQLIMDKKQQEKFIRFAKSDREKERATQVILIESLSKEKSDKNPAVSRAQVQSSSQKS